MGLDIRLPIGLMFSILGPILVVTGIVDGTPLNTATGGAMLAFGATMLIFGIAGQRRENARRAAEDEGGEPKEEDASMTTEERRMKLVA